MKEATGEANMTVITVVLVGVVAAVGAVLLPKIFTGMSTKNCCAQNGGYWYGNKCYARASCEFNADGSYKKCPDNAAFNPECK